MKFLFVEDAVARRCGRILFLHRILLSLMATLLFSKKVKKLIPLLALEGPDC